MKKILSVILSFTLVFSSMVFFANAKESQRDGLQLTDYEYAKAMLAEIMDINKYLKLYGLTAEDLRNVPVKSQEFCDGLKQILIDESNLQPANTVGLRTGSTGVDWNAIFDTSNPSAVSTESRTDADMWGYAWQMATLNKQRDPDASDIYQETKYMYMSHYIDIPTGVQFYVDETMSDDGYYSAWITNDDRNAYNTYLNGVHLAESMLEISKTIVSAINAYNDLENVNALSKLKGIRWNLEKYTNVAGVMANAADCKKAFDKAVILLANEDNPQNFINSLKAALGTENYNDVLKGILTTFVSTTIIVACGGGVSLTLSLITTTYTFCSYAYKDFFDHAWWTVLVQSNSGRIANRALRFYGLYD